VCDIGYRDAARPALDRLDRSRSSLGLKPDAGIITRLPARSTQPQEGDVLLTASGRPVFILQGEMPAYRDLVPGTSGDDVRHWSRRSNDWGMIRPIDGATMSDQRCRGRLVCVGRMAAV
jgi:hypothetical protein